MILKRFDLAGLFVGLGLATSACNDGYGYSGVGLGYGVADGYGYGDPYYGGYGQGYGAYGAGYGGIGSGYFGWYDNFYYPGTGVFVYDQYRRPHRWNAGQRRYWEGRRGGYRGGQIRDNWADFRRDNRGDLRDNRQAYRNGTIDRDQYRAGRQDARREYRNDVRQNYRQTHQENRAIRNANPGARGFRGDGGVRAGGFRGGGPRSGGFRGGNGRRNTP